jgi:hypothetical protein
VPGVTYSGEFLAVAPVFGIVNAFIGPRGEAARASSDHPHARHVNGLMLWLTSALSGAVEGGSAPLQAQYVSAH